MAPRQDDKLIERIAAGLAAQLERSSKFTSTIDPVAATTTFVRVIQLLMPQLPELRVQAGLPAKAPKYARWRTRFAKPPYERTPVPSDRVYTFWDKPLDTAPPLVQACMAQLSRVYPSLQVLDGASVRELIEIPDRIATLLENDRPAHFSDYLRTRILAQHGGLWFDATTWVQRPFDDQLQGLLKAGTVFPRWTRGSISNWFIASHARTPLIMLQFLALDAWWEANDDLPDYFLYHRIFEALRWLVPEFQGQWDATPTLSSTATHLLQLEMMQPWLPERVLPVLERNPLQKLSYKYDTVPEGSVLEHLLENGLTA